METSKTRFDVIPAQPGWQCVHLRSNGILQVGAAVVAWRIEACGTGDSVRPITTIKVAQLFGYLRPDKRFESCDDVLYESLDAAQAAFSALVPTAATTSKKGTRRA